MKFKINMSAIVKDGTVQCGGGIKGDIALLPHVIAAVIRKIASESNSKYTADDFLLSLMFIARAVLREDTRPPNATLH